MKNKLFIFFLIIICVFLFSADIFAYTQKEQGQFIQQTAKGTGLTRAGYTDIVSAVINVILAMFIAEQKNCYMLYIKKLELNIERLLLR